MKEKIPAALAVLFFMLCLQSCAAQKRIFQLYQTESSNAKLEEGSLLFENEEVQIGFNLWSGRGQSDFIIYNKSDSNIYVDLKHSHLVINGTANTYSPREELPSQAIICIPAKTSKPFAGFDLIVKNYTNCDLETYPRKTVATLSFERANSPLRFQNIITYGFHPDRLREIRYDFWVSAIKNYPEKLFIEQEQVEKCGERTDDYKKRYIFKAPDCFYGAYYRR